MKVKEAQTMLSKFEALTLSREEWTHSAHFIVAFWYCLRKPIPEAIVAIREGIKALNISLGGQNTDTTGYHETVTIFYIHLIAVFIVTEGIDQFSDASLEKLLEQSFCEKGYVHRFYTTARLMGKEARLSWVRPDAEFAVAASDKIDRPGPG